MYPSHDWGVGGSAGNLGVRHMLDWFKRGAAPRPAERVADRERVALSTEEKVERLVGRLRAGENSAEERADQPPPTAEAVERQEELPPAAEESAAAAEKPPAAEAQPGRVTALPEPVSRLPVEYLGRSRDMRVIVVASQKGGSGKTTIAAHLAVQAGMVGDGPAVLVDADWQGSLAEWWRARNDDTLALATVNPGEIAGMRADGLALNLSELRKRGFGIAIIDTPPARTAAIEQVIAVADLVLIPARPSPHDLHAVAATVDMARRAGKPFLFIVNGAAPRANITVQAVAALSEHGPVAPVILYQRTEFAAAMIDGRTVIEAAPSGKSAHEIAELWKHVYSRLSMRAAA